MRHALHLRLASRINAGEVDGLEHERREAALGGQVGDQAAREGEKVARTLDHQHGFEIGFGDAGDLEKAGVEEVAMKDDVLLAQGAGRELQFDLEETVRAALDRKSVV